MAKRKRSQVHPGRSEWVPVREMLGHEPTGRPTKITRIEETKLPRQLRQTTGQIRIAIRTEVHDPKEKNKRESTRHTVTQERGVYDRRIKRKSKTIYARMQYIKVSKGLVGNDERLKELIADKIGAEQERFKKGKHSSQSKFAATVQIINARMIPKKGWYRAKYRIDGKASKVAYLDSYTLTKKMRRAKGENARAFNALTELLNELPNVIKDGLTNLEKARARIEAAGKRKKPNGNETRDIKRRASEEGEQEQGKK